MGKSNDLQSIAIELAKLESEGLVCEETPLLMFNPREPVCGRTPLDNLLAEEDERDALDEIVVYEADSPREFCEEKHQQAVARITEELKSVSATYEGFSGADEEYQPQVVVSNVIRKTPFGDEYIRREVMDLDEFKTLIKKEGLQGYRKGGGRVFGATDFSAIDYDQFIHGTLEIHHGNNIFEVIDELDYLESRTGNMGNAEIRAFIAENEIPFGGAQEFFCTIDEEALQFIQHQREHEKPATSYEYRTADERNYHYNKLKDKFEREGFSSLKELYSVCAGVLFPKRVTSFREDGRTPFCTYLNIWTIPVTAMRSEQRKELRERYHSLADEFRQERKEKEEIQKQEVMPVLERLEAIREAGDFNELSPSECRSILAIAWMQKKHTKKNILRYNEFKIISARSKVAA